MKTFSLFSIFAIIIFSSCNKNQNIVAKQVQIDTTVASGSLYSLNLKPYGSTAKITTQAASGASSTIVSNPSLNTLVYQYTAAAAKVGVTDQVVVGVASAAQRSGCDHTDSTTVKLNITVK